MAAGFFDFCYRQRRDPAAERRDQNATALWPGYLNSPVSYCASINCGWSYLPAAFIGRQVAVASTLVRSTHEAGSLFFTGSILSREHVPLGAPDRLARSGLPFRPVREPLYRFLHLPERQLQCHLWPEYLCRFPHPLAL